MPQNDQGVKKSEPLHGLLQPTALPGNHGTDQPPRLGTLTTGFLKFLQAIHQGPIFIAQKRRRKCRKRTCHLRRRRARRHSPQHTRRQRVAGRLCLAVISSHEPRRRSQGKLASRPCKLLPGAARGDTGIRFVLRDV